MTAANGGLMLCPSQVCAEETGPLMPAGLLTAEDAAVGSDPARPLPREAWSLAAAYGVAVFARWAGTGFQFAGNVPSGVLTAVVLGVFTFFVLRGGRTAVIVVALGYTFALLASSAQLFRAMTDRQLAAAAAMVAAYGVSLILLYRLRLSPWFGWRRQHRRHPEPGVRGVVAAVVVLAACAGYVGPSRSADPRVARAEVAQGMRVALLNDKPGLRDELEARGEPSTLSRADLAAAVTVWVDGHGLPLRRLRVFASAMRYNPRWLPAVEFRTVSPEVGVRQHFCAWNLHRRGFGVYSSSCRSVVGPPQSAR